MFALFLFFFILLYNIEIPEHILNSMPNILT